MQQEGLPASVTFFPMQGNFDRMDVSIGCETFP
jgi:hypothetical protein